MNKKLIALLKDECISTEANSLSEEEVRELLVALSTGHYKPLVLNLSGTRLSPSILEKLPLVLDACPTLVYLDLSGCELSKEHEKTIGEVSLSIKKHAGLLSVDFSDNDLSLLSLSLIIDILPNNSQLLQLQLSGNQNFNSTIGRKVVEVLKQNFRLLSFLYNATDITNDLNETAVKVRDEISVLLSRNQDHFLSHPASLMVPAPVVTFIKNMQFKSLLLEDKSQLSVQPMIFSPRKQTESEKKPTLVAKRAGPPLHLQFSLRQTNMAPAATAEKRKRGLDQG